MAELKKPRRPKGSGSRPKASGKKIKKILKKVTKKVPVKKLKQKITAKKTTAKKSKIKKSELTRSLHNPMIWPEENMAWESKATFNPTAFYNDGKVHIVYRAIGDSDNSVLGYAASKDGMNISERFPYPIYSHHSSYFGEKTGTPFISYSSGGGWGGGCEDPRMTLLGDRVYMLYTAFDGWGSVRIALTSISLNDFISKHWNWKKPVLISMPGEIHKNWVLFPEKIKGRFAILHSISPKVLVDYFDKIEDFDNEKFIHSVHQGSQQWQLREKGMRGVGPAPIRTRLGWLVLYHGTEEHDASRYKIFAMILDASDPTKILYRSNKPVLEPDEWYENEGYKGGVVYSCGAVVKEGVLFVYYGGADKVSCVAEANLDAFLSELVKSNVLKLTGKKLRI